MIHKRRVANLSGLDISLRSRSPIFNILLEGEVIPGATAYTRIVIFVTEQDRLISAGDPTEGIHL